MPATRSGSGIAQQPRRPHHGLPIRGDKLASFDDATQLLIVLHRDELGRVDGHVLRELAPGDEILAARQRLRHVEAVDVAAENHRSRWRARP